jgi:hypothetical protein
MAEYRLTRGYSGIQYRIVEIPEIRWAMHGYQADNDAAQQYIRADLRRARPGISGIRGQSVLVEASAKPAALGSLGSEAATY